MTDYPTYSPNTRVKALIARERLPDEQATRHGSYDPDDLDILAVLDGLPGE